MDLDDLMLPNDISKKKKKPLTKAAVAKKMIKKQIKPNQKTVFDDTGEVHNTLWLLLCDILLLMNIIFLFIRPFWTKPKQRYHN